MKIYHVDAEDLMNSTMRSDRTTIGYFRRKSAAESARDDYNAQLSPRLRKTSFRAVITEIEVVE